jgi:hypothetical protein
MNGIWRLPVLKLKESSQRTLGGGSLLPVDVERAGGGTEER